MNSLQWLMIISGLLTGTMLYALVAPKAALISTFGETLEGPLADIVVRNWGALIGLIGAMLIYGAFDPPIRSLVLTVAGASKLIFSGLVLFQGGRFLRRQAGLAITIDLIMVALFSWYLFGVGTD